MIRSMTAFARVEGPAAGQDLVWELKSVNHRYLEVSPRLPEQFRDLDNAVREKCRQRLSRGKVEVTLRPGGGESTESLTLDEDLVRQLSELTRRVGDIVQHPGTVSPLELLRFPGVLAAAPQDRESQSRAALALLDQALDRLLATREREGAALRRLVADRLSGVSEQAGQVRQALPGIREELRERLRRRVQEVSQSADPDRLEQELVFMAQKMDVDEELDRLDTHVAEVSRILDEGGTVGRRLDFLMQELNREANTLASKSVSSTTSAAAVELKVLIEQMREQIQNIE
jgi:uncharacterized protein (TIGR00255 family)